MKNLVTNKDGEPIGTEEHMDDGAFDYDYDNQHPQPDFDGEGIECSVCNGTGENEDYSECKNCNGTGYV